ncbi:hypothetical protein L3Q82_022247, partial [Scortum barcoo]
FRANSAVRSQKEKCSLRMPTYVTPVATMNCFCPVDPTGGNRRQWQDYSSGDHITQSTQQEVRRSHSTSSRSAGGERSSRDGEPGEDEPEGPRDGTASTAVKSQQDATEMQSQYQKDFPPPSSCRRRRTPALPQPDNIGINPAFRIEFSTVQKEAYPGWPIVNPRCAGRLRAASE